MISRFPFFIILLSSSLSITIAQDSIKINPYSAFSFVLEVTLPGSPEKIYDAVTGDISGWWDHSFSESPKAFYIDPKPGGGFYEIVDDEGNGLLHATVITALRGKILRFEGPLGLSGRAVQMVHTYSFEPVENDSTLMKIEVHGSGEFEENVPGVVRNVWKHFIFEQLKSYIESGKH